MGVWTRALLTAYATAHSTSKNIRKVSFTALSNTAGSTSFLDHLSNRPGWRMYKVFCNWETRHWRFMACGSCSIGFPIAPPRMRKQPFDSDNVIVDRRGNIGTLQRCFFRIFQSLHQFIAHPQWTQYLLNEKWVCYKHRAYVWKPQGMDTIEGSIYCNDPNQTGPGRLLQRQHQHLFSTASAHASIPKVRVRKSNLALEPCKWHIVFT